MNPVFWLLVILAIAGAWFLLAPIFRGTGKIGINILNKAKDKMKPIDNEKESEDKSK